MCSKCHFAPQDSSACGDLQTQLLGSMHATCPVHVGPVQAETRHMHATCDKRCCPACPGVPQDKLCACGRHQQGLSGGAVALGEAGLQVPDGPEGEGLLRSPACASLREVLSQPLLPETSSREAYSGLQLFLDNTSAAEVRTPLASAFTLPVRSAERSLTWPASESCS